MMLLVAFLLWSEPQCSTIMSLCDWSITDGTKSKCVHKSLYLLYNRVLLISCFSEHLTASLASDIKPMRLFHTRLMSFRSCCSFSEHTAIALMPSSTRRVTRYTSTTPGREKHKVQCVSLLVLLHFQEIHNVQSSCWLCLPLTAH